MSDFWRKAKKKKYFRLQFHYLFFFYPQAEAFQYIGPFYAIQPPNILHLKKLQKLKHMPKIKGIESHDFKQKKI